MATTAELLAAGTDTERIWIDVNSRTINIPSSLTLLGVTSDEDVQKLTFAMSRYYNGIDLSRHAIRINYENAQGEGDVYRATDIVVTADTIEFVWVVSRHATKYAGDVKFTVCAPLTDDDSNIDKEFNTIPTTLPVIEGLETDAAELLEDYPDVIDAVAAETFAKAKASGQFANAIKGNASGEVIRVDDVSPIDHSIACNIHGNVYVYGKNLIPYPYDSNSITRSGITFTVLSDGGISIKGTATTGTGFDILRHDRHRLSLKKGKVYTLTCWSTFANAAGYVMLKNYNDDGAIVDDVSLMNGSSTFTAESDGYAQLNIIVASGATLDETIYIQLEEGSVATEYEPYVEPVAVTITACGENLFDQLTQRGAYDPSTGVCDSSRYALCSTNALRVIEGQKYYNRSDVTLYYFFYDENDNFIAPECRCDSGEFCIAPANATKMRFNISSSYGVTYNYDVCVGMTDGGFALYVGSTYTANADGSCVVTSISPTMTLFTNTPGATMEAEYSRDTAKAVAEKFSKVETDVRTAANTAIEARKIATQAQNAVDDEIIPRLETLEQNSTGGNITVDDKLDGTSTNPVQNKVLYSEINGWHSGLYGVETGVKQANIKVASLEEKVTALEQNGTGGGLPVENVTNYAFAIADKDGRVAFAVDKNGKVIDGNGELDTHNISNYAFAIADRDGNIALAIDENGKVTYVGQNDKPLKQNGNYDAEINMFICYGQSWSTGYDVRAITTTPRYDNLMLDTGIMNNPLSDLSVTATSFVPAVERTGKSSPNGQTVGETPVTAQMHIVKQLMESEDGLTVDDLSYQLLGTAPGVGSATLAMLASGTNYYKRLIDQVQEAYKIATDMGKRLVVQAFSWVQGTIGDYPKDENGIRPSYAEALERLRIDIDTDVKAITGQTQDVKCITWQSFLYNGISNPDQAYDQFVGASETYPNIICSGATYHLDTLGPNPDTGVGNLHFTNESQDWLGAYFGVAYKRTIIDGEDFEPVKPTKASKAGKILYVKFNVPQRPLVFDTDLLTEATNKGFKLYAADGTEKSINDVAIISPDTVKIVCADNVLSDDRLTYGKITDAAFQWANDNHGNLRDSQGDYIQYVIDEYTKIIGSNTIVVPSHALPVHNWCVIFDKKISDLEV